VGCIFVINDCDGNLFEGRPIMFASAERFLSLMEHLREVFPTVRPYEITYDDGLDLYWHYISDRDLLCVYNPHFDIIHILYLHEPLHFDFRKDHLFIKEKTKAIYIPYDSIGFHSHEQYIVDLVQHDPLWISSSGKDIFIELFSEDELLLRIYHINRDNFSEYEIQDFRIPSPKDIYRIKFAEETYIIRNLGSHYEFQFDVEGEFPEILYQSSHLEVEGKEIYPITIKKEFRILERDIGTFGFSHGRFYYKFGKAIVCTSPFSSYLEDHPLPFSSFED
jgi:hypothetical protein